MQFVLPFERAAGPSRQALVVIAADGRAFPLDVRRHPRARRYVLRVTRTGSVRLTVPRRASVAGGVRFANTQVAWIAREWLRQQQADRPRWDVGATCWWRGERTRLRIEADVIVCGDTRMPLRQASPAAIERYLRAVAARELPARARALAAQHGCEPARISVRNQRSRWGACSGRDAITLNWRLLQMPPSVADYVILHELAHLAHHNHSRRFWRRVAELCPGWREAERWLKIHGDEIL